MSGVAVHGTLLARGERSVQTRTGEFKAFFFENVIDHRPMIVLGRGDFRSEAPLLARVHSSCVTSESFGGKDCDCADQMSRALDRISQEGRGVLFYLMQEGRGAGFAIKARDRMLVQASGHRLTTFEAYEQMGLGRDLRRYDEVGFAGRLLGITAPLRLLTNNPEKVAALQAAKVRLESTDEIPGTISPFNLHYIDSKRRSGHSFEARPEELRPAELPEPVLGFEPEPADDVVRLASYLLPVSLDEDPIAWFRVNVAFDVPARSEHVVLSHGGGATPLVGLHREELLDRLPLREPHDSARRWRATVRAITEHGAGHVFFRTAETRPTDFGDAERFADWIARHVESPRVRTILAADGSDPLAPALERRGFEIETAIDVGSG